MEHELDHRSAATLAVGRLLPSGPARAIDSAIMLPFHQGLTCFTTPVQ